MKFWQKSGPNVPKEYSFLSPEGILHTGKSIRDFARKHGLDAANMQHVYLGERSHHKGWRLPESA